MWPAVSSWVWVLSFLSSAIPPGPLGFTRFSVSSRTKRKEKALGESQEVLEARPGGKHYCRSPSIGQVLVTWSHPTAEEDGRTRLPV